MRLEGRRRSPAEIAAREIVEIAREDDSSGIAARTRTDARRGRPDPIESLVEEVVDPPMAIPLMRLACDGRTLDVFWGYEFDRPNEEG